MHWWHAAQFALWDRLPLLERSLGYYDAILPKARATAARQGYAGARWPKMTSPTGDESPSNVGPFLVWQQPHPIFYAELVYRARPTRQTLEQYRAVVFATAEFMASLPAPDASGTRLVLGPPLQCAQETYPKDRTTNCTYELSYWAWGLQTAQAWRERLGLARLAEWDRVLARLANAVHRGRQVPVRRDARRTRTRTRVGPRTIHRSSPRSASCLARDIDRAVMDRTRHVDLGQLELADDVGLGLPDARHDRGAPRQARARDRRAAAGHAEEHVPRERPQPSAAGPDDLPARERRACSTRWP